MRWQRLCLLWVLMFLCVDLVHLCVPKYPTTFASLVGWWEGGRGGDLKTRASIFWGCVSFSGLIYQEGNAEQQKVCEEGHVSYVQAKHNQHADVRIWKTHFFSAQLSNKVLPHLRYDYIARLFFIVCLDSLISPIVDQLHFKSFFLWNWFFLTRCIIMDSLTVSLLR